MTKKGVKKTPEICSKNPSRIPDIRIVYFSRQSGESIPGETQGMDISQGGTGRFRAFLGVNFGSFWPYFGLILALFWGQKWSKSGFFGQKSTFLGSKIDLFGGPNRETEQGPGNRSKNRSFSGGFPGF
jgi:hypothetical protein